jgi:nitroreductase
MGGMDAIDLILRRRSVREYTKEPVEEEVIQLLLRAAMAAPTAINQKPWEFVVVTDPDILRRLREHLVFGRYDAPCAIAVCGNRRFAHPSNGWDYWEQDCSAATENLLLAATGLGLGTVWIGVHPLPSVIRPVSAILNLPEDVIPLSLVYVGHAATMPEPRSQFDERRVHWQTYEPRKRRAREKNPKKK